MAGTHKRRSRVERGGPVVILVSPQLGENIGAAARAMLNAGLTQLRLVRPRDGWPNAKAVAAAAGAEEVLADARLFDSTAEAVGDLTRVYATTARRREMIKPAVTARQAALELRRAASRDERAGLMFGPERAGLTNEDLTLADTLVTVPLNPGFSSLNLAQAVLILAYEWFQAGVTAPARQLVTNATRPGTKKELLNFFAHLEAALDDARYFKTVEKRPAMVRTIRNLFQRAELTEQEIRTLHGIVKELQEGRRG
ncbi:MAG TPA: RNA methyltransferase [Alphaproteobacteria bacterium]|nr:RNA methyltransferase [Alphaproteobacteria bacterium]